MSQRVPVKCPIKLSVQESSRQWTGCINFLPSYPDHQSFFLTGSSSVLASRWNPNQKETPGAHVNPNYSGHRPHVRAMTKISRFDQRSLLAHKTAGVKNSFVASFEHIPLFAVSKERRSNESPVLQRLYKRLYLGLYIVFSSLPRGSQCNEKVSSEICAESRYDRKQAADMCVESLSYNQRLHSRYKGRGENKNLGKRMGKAPWWQASPSFFPSTCSYFAMNNSNNLNKLLSNSIVLLYNTLFASST